VCSHIPRVQDKFRELIVPQDVFIFTFCLAGGKTKGSALNDTKYFLFFYGYNYETRTQLKMYLRSPYVYENETYFEKCVFVGVIYNPGNISRFF
jgi:hypothetical protein